MPSYTLDELIKKMEPQAQRDKALMAQCIDGLGLYAAQIARDNSNSSKIAETRKLVENLVGYWGLDDGESAPSQDDFLSAFDEQIHAAKSGAEIAAGTYRGHTDTIYGLHRYGEEMVVAQGNDAMSEILDMGDLMKEIAGYWDFEPYAVVDDLAAKLRAEVRTMLEAIPLPGQPDSEVNAGYKIQQVILFNNDRGFALAHNPNAPAPFVTWQFTNDGGTRDYYWGKYYGSEEKAKVNYISRVVDYIDTYKVTEKPIPAAAAEMSAEQNYNMIDGVRNNEAPAERFPVRVLSESQPLVTVTFSEHDQLRGIEKMPLYLADKLFEELDEKHIETRRQPGYDGASFLRTDYRIDFIIDGKPDSFSGEYAVGDDDGSLLYRIYHYNEWNRRDNEDYQRHLAGQGGDVQAAENARLDHIINKLVPFFETHCELSEKEAAALSELMCIQDDKAHGKPVDDARAGYLETVMEYTCAARAALNTTGIDSLPEEPKPCVETVKDRAAPVPCVQASVLEQIRAAREAPRQPSRPKPERSKKAQGLEL